MNSKLCVVFLKGLLRRLVLVSEENLLSVNNKKPGKRFELHRMHVTDSLLRRPKYWSQPGPLQLDLAVTLQATWNIAWILWIYLTYASGKEPKESTCKTWRVIGRTIRLSHASASLARFSSSSGHAIAIILCYSVPCLTDLSLMPVRTTVKHCCPQKKKSSVPFFDLLLMWKHRPVLIKPMF